MSRTASILTAAREVVLGGLRVSLDLFKIMVPIIVAVKLLRELGLVRYLAVPLEPVMGLVGLPGEMGLVWATAMLNNIYSAIVVLLSLARDVPLTSAQATVLAVMILVAHNLPVELTIARKAGARLPFQLAVRILGALALGGVMHLAYSAFGALQGPAVLLFQPTGGGPQSLWQWALSEARTLFSVFCIITALLGLMRLLHAVRGVDLINAALRPVLRLMGIGPRASTITVIGLAMGLAYGGGLIIHEARSGQVDRRDVFFSLTLMGLCHSLIEDTLLLLLAGGHLSGILWGRLVFSLLTVTALVRLAGKLPAAFGDRHLWAEAR